LVLDQKKRVVRERGGKERKEITDVSVVIGRRDSHQKRGENARTPENPKPRSPPTIEPVQETQKKRLRKLSQKKKSGVPSHGQKRVPGWKLS